MINPRETRTNAADSAPGVDDGPAGVPAPPVNSRPGGRMAVWIGVLVVALIVLVAFFARPLNKSEPAGPTQAASVAQPEVTQPPPPPGSNG